MSIATKTALVTGSAGFLGRHMTRKLLNGGYAVTAVDIASEYHAADARDFFRTNSIRYDLVVHCAGLIGGRETIENNSLKQAVNFELDAGLFQYAFRTRPYRVVYISSSAVYPTMLQGSLEQTLNEEDTRTSSNSRIKVFGLPDQLYGWSKLTGEMLADKYRETELAVTVVRPFSGYGEDQSLDYPFPAFAQRAKARADPFVIWGDGNQVRDWIHVDDICQAIVTLVDQNVDGPVNLGTGVGTSMFDLAKMFVEEISGGYNPQFEFKADRPQGVRYRVSDNAKLRQFYKPTVSLSEGVRRAVRS